MNKSTYYKIRDFGMYLILLDHPDRLSKLAKHYGISEKRIKQILRKVDDDYQAHAKEYFDYMRSKKISAE